MVKSLNNTRKQKAIPEIAVSLLHSLANTSVQKHEAKVGELSTEMGMTSLFPNARDIAAAERAYVKVQELIAKEDIDAKDFVWLRPKLITVSQIYWAEYERDKRLSFSDMKREVASLQKEVAKIIERLSGLPPATREALNAGVNANLTTTQVGPRPNHVAELLKGATRIHEACTPIASKDNKKIRRSYRFQRCAAELWNIRENITGKTISKIFEFKLAGGFTTADAAFIHGVMHAIDENVTESQVQDGLRRNASAKTKIMITQKPKL